MINKVAGYRKMLSLTQKQMAEYLGISEGQYRVKENGKYDFSQSEMKIFFEVTSKRIKNIGLEDIFF